MLYYTFEIFLLFFISFSFEVSNGFTPLSIVSDSPLSPIILGNQILRDSNYAELYDSRVLILGNPTSVFQDNMKHIVDDLHEKVKRHVNETDEVKDRMKSIKLAGVLSPEHGFRGDKQAESSDPFVYIDKVTDLPVWSAYKMSTEDLSLLFVKRSITTIVVDIQDVGVRLYTFVWTMQKVMKAAALIWSDIFEEEQSEYYNQQRKKIKIVVLDRPNPLGGVLVDGPLLNMTCCASGYGNDEIPHIHGMTIGELSYFFLKDINSSPHSGKGSLKKMDQEVSKKDVDYLSFSFASELLELVVIPTRGWSRNTIWKDTKLRWVPPSPNLPTPESTLTYSSTVFLEATTVSEGRGTCTPFSEFGAPFINNLDFVNYLNSEYEDWSFSKQKSKEENNLVQSSRTETIAYNYECFRASYFNPVFFKYNNTIVDGIQWFPYCTWIEKEGGEIAPIVSPFALATIILRGFITRSSPPASFYFDGSWFGHPGTQLIDFYAGTFLYREMLLNVKNYTVENIITYFQKDVEKFKKNRRHFLLYE